MLIIHGTYHWYPERVAFRNDFCLNCEAQCKAVQVRTLDVFHVFWVPVLPLGFWKRWFCGNCGHQPNCNKKTRFGYKIAGFFTLVFFSILFWFMPVKPGDVGYIWTFRIGAPLAAVVTLVHLFRSTRDPSYEVRFQSVLPATDLVCPFCHEPLAEMPEWRCPVCRIVRL